MMPFEKSPFVAASSWKKWTSSRVAAAAAMRVCAISPTLRGRLHSQDNVRRFGTQDGGARASKFPLVDTALKVA